MPDAPLLKDFIDRPRVQIIVDAVGKADPRIDPDEIMAQIFDDQWADRELKQRTRHIAVTIRSSLAEDYAEALAVMREAAELVEVGTMACWSFNDFVEEFGVEYPDISLPALEQFTKLVSAEFAVRHFIVRYPERMADQMLRWAKSDDADVRRLGSEGFRPWQPWGIGIRALKADPSPILPVLEQLYRDPDEVVRRSVANNLNDISRDNPDVALAVMGRWTDGSDETQALLKHALRGLLKKGHPGALELLGFSSNPSVEIVGLRVEPSVCSVGSNVHVEFSVHSTSEETQQLMVDYAVVFQNVSGTGSRKVFKGVVVDLEAGDSLAMRRNISLQQRTTRRILPGPHAVETQVNGVVLGSVGFEVTR